MEPEKHLNVWKVVIVIAIFVFAFIIILVSALMTKRAKGNVRKDLEIREVNQVKNVEKVKSEENLKNENNSSGILKNVLNDIQNNLSNDDNQEGLDNASNNEEMVELRVPVSNPNALMLCKEAQTSNEKNIYLTFDDGPSPNVTPQILQTLKHYNVPATFFVLGSRVELYPEVVKQEYNEGHYIANHGYSHKYSSIYSSVQAVIDEYNATEKLLFRFPGGSSGGPYDDLKREAKSILEGMGIVSTNWNCLTGDAEAEGRTKEELLNRLYSTAEGWSSLVVLMHDCDDKQTTAEALPEIIEHYIQQGYTFKNYYDIFK